jgi:hypothetical protein
MMLGRNSAQPLDIVEAPIASSIRRGWALPAHGERGIAATYDVQLNPELQSEFSSAPAL